MKNITVSAEAIEILRHIITARIDHATRDGRTAWASARDIIEYALEGNIECLAQFDYLETYDEIIEKNQKSS